MYSSTFTDLPLCQQNAKMSTASMAKKGNKVKAALAEESNEDSLPVAICDLLLANPCGYITGRD